MESSESHEPSYYEVALTNRQVLIAFVVLLTSIVAAFLSGVWIGRGGSTPARPTAGISEAAATVTEPPLEQLTFFSGKEAGSRTGAAAPSGGGTAAAAPANPPRPASASDDRDATPAAPADTPTAEEAATEAMRQNLDATMAANRTVPAPAAPAGTRVTTQPVAPAAVPAKPVPAPAKPAAAAAKETATPKPAVAGKIFVQVYSSTNVARAKEIVAQLRKAGFAVVVAETPKGGGTNSRVRVGPYAERAKADAAAARLRRDFRLETWVTDSP